MFACSTFTIAAYSRYVPTANQNHFFVTNHFTNSKQPITASTSSRPSGEFPLVRRRGRLYDFWRSFFPDTVCDVLDVYPSPCRTVVVLTIRPSGLCDIVVLLLPLPLEYDHVIPFLLFCVTVDLSLPCVRVHRFDLPPLAMIIFSSLNEMKVR